MELFEALDSQADVGFGSHRTFAPTLNSGKEKKRKKTVLTLFLTLTVAFRSSITIQHLSAIESLSFVMD